MFAETGKGCDGQNYQGPGVYEWPLGGDSGCPLATPTVGPGRPCLVDQCLQNRWHKRKDVFCMGVQINHLLGIVPCTLKPLYCTFVKGGLFLFLSLSLFCLQGPLLDQTWSAPLHAQNHPFGDSTWLGTQPFSAS